MIIKDELKKNGIILANTKPGTYKIDCPKDYCKKARLGFDTECMTLIITASGAKWKCSNCLWTGELGQIKDKKDKPLLSFDPFVTVVLAHPASAKILTDAGVPNVVSYEGDVLKAHAPLWKQTKRVVIAFDNVPEADKDKQEVIRRIGAAKCWTVNYYAKTCEKTFKEHGADFICQDINEATPHPLKGLYEVDDFMDDMLAYFNGRMAAGVKTGWPNVDKLYTVMPAQLTVVTGIPNSGKSTWLDALLCNLSETHGWKHAIFSPENPRELHTIKLAQKIIKMPIDPKSNKRMSEEALINGAKWVKDHFKFIFSSSMEDPPTLDWILERASDAVLRWGIKGLVIDPWNRVVKKYDPGQTENAYIETALAKILRFAHNHEVHVWLVAHPTKQEADKKTGQYVVPSLYSISGGANFPNMMDNGIVIYRPSGADTEHVTEVWVRKVRFDHVGQVGHTNLKYSKDTGCFEVIDEEYTAQAPDLFEEDDGYFSGDGIKIVEPM